MDYGLSEFINCDVWVLAAWTLHSKELLGEAVILGFGHTNMSLHFKGVFVPFNIEATYLWIISVVPENAYHITILCES